MDYARIVHLKLRIMMLNPRLTDCAGCINIPALIEEIDCKITELAKSAYNDLVFALNSTCKKSVMYDLLIYRNILLYKQCNREYAGKFTVEQISSKVKLLINK